MTIPYITEQFAVPIAQRLSRNPIENMLSEEGEAPYYEQLAQALVSEAQPGQTLITRKDVDISKAARIGRAVTRVATNPGFGFLQTLLHDVLGIPDPLEGVNKTIIAGALGSTGYGTQVEQVGAGSQEMLDVTDPGVDVGDRKLNEYERLLRNVRRLGRSIRYSLDAPRGIPSTAGGTRAVLEGNLAPPATKDEQLIGAIAPMIAGLGVFAPLGTSMAGAKLAQGIGTPAISTALRTELFPSLGAGTAFDALLGGLFGASEVASHEALGEEVPPGETALLVGGGLAAGAAVRPGLVGGAKALEAITPSLKRIFGAKTPVQMARAVADIERLQTEGVIAREPGSRWGDKVAGRTASGRLVYRWAPDSPNFDPKNPNKFAPAPTVEDDAAAAKQVVDKYRQLIERVPEATREDFVPADMKARDSEATIIGALWYNNQRELLEGTAAQRLAGQLKLTKLVVADPAYTPETRLTAYGRQKALEAILRRGAGTGVDDIPIEAEALALEIVRRNRPVVGEQGLESLAGIYESEGDALMASRIRFWAKTNIPEKAHAKVHAAIDKLSRAERRGYSKGSQAITKDGQIVELMDEPDYGVAWVRSLSDPQAKPDFLETADLIPLPRPNMVIRTNDGRLVRVKTVAPEKGEFTGIDAGTRKPNAYKFSDIREVTDRSGKRRLSDEELALFIRKVLVDDTQTIPATPATVRGEAVTVEEIGSNAAKVRTKSGKQKTVARDELRRSTENRPQIQELLDTVTEKVKKGAKLKPKVTYNVADREIVDFAPGTRPEEGNRIWFFRVPDSDLQAFEQAYQAGPLTAETFPVKYAGQPVAHALPQEPIQGASLYVLEVPGDIQGMKGHSDAAKSAIAALGANERVLHYNSPIDLSPEVLAAGRVYRVPDELHIAAQQPKEALAAMDQAQQTAYLRRLIALDETMDNRIAEVTRPVREAREAAVDAFNDNRAQDMLEAQKVNVKATVTAAKRLARVKADQFEEDFVPQWLADLKGEKAGLRHRLRSEGLHEETRAFYAEQVNDLAETPREAIPFETMVSKNINDEELTLRVTKLRVPALKGDQPSTEILFRAEPVLANGRTLEEGVKEFYEADQLIRYMVDEGYTGSLHKTVRADFIHPDHPNLRAAVIPVGKQFEVAVSTIPEGEFPPPAPAPVAKGQKGVPRNLRALIGEGQEDVASGTLLFDELSREPVETYAEGAASLQAKGFVFNKAADISRSHTDQFAKLPPLSELEALDATAVPGGPEQFALWGPDQLEIIRQDLGVIMTRLIQETRHVPPAVREYARGFAEIYRKLVGRSPWSRELRFAIQLPTIEDLGPAGQGGINYNELAQNLPAGQKYKSAWGTPAPVVERAGTQPGAIMDVGEVLDVKPTMHLRNATESLTDRLVPKDYHKLYREILGYKADPSIPQVEAAGKIGELMIEQSRMTPTVLKAMSNPATPVSPILGSGKALGRYRPTDQLVEVLDANPASNTMTVKFPGEGAIEIATDDFIPSEFMSKDIPDFRYREMIADGHYADYVKREPEPGYGPEEREMGLFGAHPHVVHQAFVNRAAELASDILVAENGVPTGKMAEILALYRRAHWLGVTEVKPGAQPHPFARTRGETVEYEPLPPGAAILGRGAKEFIPRRTIAEDILGAIKAVDPGLVKPFKRAAEQLFRASLGNTPFAKLQAKAFTGDLSEGHTKLLRTWANELGLDAAMPMHRVIAELAIRKVIDPHAARVAVQLKNDAGFFAWGAQIGAGPQDRLRLWRISQLGDPGMGVSLNRPFKLLSRMPQTKFLFDGIGEANMVQRQRQLHSLQFLNDTFKHGYDSKDWNTVRGLIQKHSSWDAATKAGADPRHEYLFGRLKERMALNKEDLIRQALRYDTEYIEFQPGNKQHEDWLREINIAPEDVGEGFVFLPREIELAKGWTGVKPSEFWTHDNIETFLSLQRRYPDAKSLPDDVPEEMRKVFDLWKRYGIDNYWPLVHEGNRAVVVERDGKEVLLAWAQSHMDAVTAIDRLMASGRIQPGEQAHIRMREPFDDDIVVRMWPNAREWKGLERLLSETGNVDNVPQALLLRSDKPIPPAYAKKGRQVHLKPRVADLEPVIPDAIKEFMLYEARLARSDFRYNVSQSFRLFQDRALDRAMANRYGLEPIWTRAGKSNYPKLTSYAEDYVRQALGQQTKHEIRQDEWKALTDMLSNAPRLTVAKVAKELSGGKYPLELAEIWKPKNYYRKYAARENASSQLAFQAAAKLAISPGSALWNATQFWLTTVPRMIEPGFNEVQAAALAFKSWRDGIRLFAHQLPVADRILGKIPKSLEREARLMAESGIALSPGKHMAGAANFGEISGTRPLNVGQSKAELAIEWAKYVSMIGFNGAEAVNRYSTALVAIRRALAKGQSEAAAIASARKMVRETQFEYDELSMPSIVRDFPYIGGPIMRVLTQFKPFAGNMLAFEKDLVMNALRITPTTRADIAWRQLGLHVGGIAMLGGATGLLYHPLISGIGHLIKYASGGKVTHVAGVPLTAEQAMVDRANKRLEMKTPEEAFTSTMHYDWDDALYYGVGGRFHLNIGQRVGVSGQDLTFARNASSLLGPQYGAFYEFADAMKTYAQSPRSGRGNVGALAGTLAPTFIPGALGRAVRAAPFSRTAGAYAGAHIASLGSDNNFGEFLFGTKRAEIIPGVLGVTAPGDETPSGRKIVARALPVAFRNFLWTWELFSDHALRDIDGKPAYIPADDILEEMFYTLASAPTIRRTEYAASIAMLVDDDRSVESKRQGFVDRIARARALGTEEGYIEANRLLMMANEEGVYIPESSVQRELETLTTERIETIRRPQSPTVRFGRPQ